MDDKDFYLNTIQQLPAVSGGAAQDNTVKDQINQIFHDFLNLQHLYDSAIEVVRTYLNILDSEFSVKFQPQSIIGKLQKKGLPITTEAAEKNLLDMAGIRVTCCYISDIYAIADMLSRRDDFVVIKKKDYIINPKKSGYRSFHMIINVPVYLSAQKKYAPVEIQIRTIAMDFWASLEHQLKYKTSTQITPELSEQLRECADKIAETDMQMQQIFTQLNDID